MAKHVRTTPHAAAPRRRTLALACAATLGLALPVAPAWAACTGTALAATGSAGTDGTTGSSGNVGGKGGDASNGGDAATASTGGPFCVDGGSQLIGGAGGNGGDGGTGTGLPGKPGLGGTGGLGGDGGAGMRGTVNFQLTNDGDIMGGAGGNGGSGGLGSDYSGTGQTGGAGGAAVDGVGFSLTNNASIVGGVGGAGGHAGFRSGADGAYGPAGAGGQGGAGIHSSGASVIANSGSIAGGAGGTSGKDFHGTASGGEGGAGLGGDGFVLVNTGDIVGGAAGNGGDAFGGQIAGNGGDGGAGIWGSNLAITNAGTIGGGQAGVGGAGAGGGVAGLSGTHGDAVHFTGGANMLTLDAGSVLNGAVEIDDGSTATLAMHAAQDLDGGAFGGDALIVNGAARIDAGAPSTISGTIRGTGTLDIAGGGITLGNVNLGGLTSDAPTTLLADVTTRGGGQHYGGTVRLGSSLTLTDFTNGAIGFDSTIDGAFNLSVSTVGVTDFGGAVGGTEALNNISVTSGSIGLKQSWNILGLANLLSNGDITEAPGASLAASMLAGSAAGSVDLQGSPNAIQSIGSFYANGFSLLNANTLSVLDSGILDGGSGDVSLGTTSGNIYVNQGARIAGANIFLAPAGLIDLSGALSTPGTIHLGNVLQVHTGSTIDGAIDNGTVIDFFNTDRLALAGAISGGGDLNLHSGRVELEGINTYTGATTISGGALALSGLGGIADSSVVLVGGSGSFDISATDAGARITTLAGSGAVTLGGRTLTLTNAGDTYKGIMSGGGGFELLGGTEVFTGANTYTGTTTVNAGSVLQIGSGGTSGSIVGDAGVGGQLRFDRGDDLGYAGKLSGTGRVSQQGAGVLTLDGDSGNFAGQVDVSGALVVGSTAGNGAALGGTVNVRSGGTLGGHGTVGSAGKTLTVSAGGTIAPGGVGSTLHVAGNLSAALGSFFAYGYGTPGADFATPGAGSGLSVGGNVTLNGARLDVTDADGMGPGLYNVLTYGGSFSGSGFVLGNTPNRALSLQYLGAQKQVNLIDTTGLTLGFWNANGQASSTRMGGGDGVWSNTSATWTDATGSVPNAAMQPRPGMAVFGGTPGTVTVDGGAGTVAATGMQFATNGYTLEGAALDLAGSGGAAPVIRVGDGSSAGAGMTATVANILNGADGLTKDDLGTLVLANDNVYTGGTTIAAGTLQIGNGGHSGWVEGDIVDNGRLAFDRSDTIVFGGTISGAGGLVQSGRGNLTLTGTNGYTGSTTIASGTLTLSGDGSVAASSLVDDDGTLDIQATNHGASIVSLSGTGTVQLGSQPLILTAARDTFSGSIFGSGSLTVAGGHATLSGGNVYTGGTSIHAGATLQIGDGGVGGSIGGDVLNDGALVYALGNTGMLAGTVAGVGSVRVASGGLVLSGDNTYTGGTTVDAPGALYLGTGGSQGWIVGDVTDHGLVAFNRSDATTFAGTISGSGQLQQTGSGTLTLTGGNTYTGLTTIAAGATLRVGNGGTSGAIAGDVSNRGTLVFDRSDVAHMDGALDGSGTLVQQGTGKLIVDGDAAAFAGSTQVANGTLHVGSVAGNGAILGGEVDVQDGAALGGRGAIGGNVTLHSGGHLAPGTGESMLTIHGSLVASQGSWFDFRFGTPGPDFLATGTGDSVRVDGDVELHGAVLDVTDGGGMGPGLYNVLTYGGALDGAAGGLVLGDSAGGGLALQYLSAQKQVNLIDTAGMTLGFWNANGQASATRMGGGSGTWTANSATWTDAGGVVPNAAMFPRPGLAVFGGAPGTVAVAESAGGVAALGLQFAVDGYRLTGDAIHLVGSAGAAPVIRVGDGSGTGAGMTATLDNVLVGSDGLVKNDLGMLVLNGDSGAFGGGTIVQAGTLEIGDAATPSASLGGAVTVATAGVLRGHGSIGGAVTNNGTVRAGGSIGTLAIKGDYIQTASGALNVDVTPDGKASLLAIGGHATLAGSALVLEAPGTWAPQTSYTILTAGGGISGEFTSVQSSLAFLVPTLVYGENALTLSLKRNGTDFSGVAQTPNQAAVATAANGLGSGNPVYDALVLLDAQAARHAFDQLDGQIHAGLRTAIMDDERGVRDAVSSHLLDWNRGNGSREGRTEEGTSVWTAAWARSGSQHGDGDTATLDGSGGGMLVGVDVPVGDAARVGGLIGVGHVSDSLDALDSSAQGRTRHAGIYASLATGGFHAMGGAIYGRQALSTRRRIDIPGLEGRVTGDYHAVTSQAYVDGSYVFALGSGTLAPFVDVATQRLRTDRFTETGVAALDGRGGASRQTYGSMGLRGTLQLGADGSVQAHGSVGWRQAWGDVAAAEALRFAGGGGAFTTHAVPVARRAATANAGLRFLMTPRLALDADYDGQFAHRFDDQTARISVSYAF